MVTIEELNLIMNNIESENVGLTGYKARSTASQIKMARNEKNLSDEDIEDILATFKAAGLNIKLPKFDEEESEKYYGLKAELVPLVEIFNNSEYLKSLMTKKGGKSYANGDEFVKSAFLDKVERIFKKNSKNTEDSK